MANKTMERGSARVVEIVTVALIALLIGACFLPTCWPSGRALSCGNNLRNVGLAIFQYAERYQQTMPTAYENTWNRLVPHMGTGTDAKLGGDEYRCSEDAYLTRQSPWGEGNQTSCAPNADETGSDALKPEDWAGWKVTVEGREYGAQYSPFTARFKGGGAEELAVVRLNSVATDTILMAECWRANTQNSLFLQEPATKMRMTTGVPVVRTRNALLLKQYTATTGYVVNASGRLTDAGPFNFLIDFAADQTALEKTYHRGRMNVLYADGHVQTQKVAEMIGTPGTGVWTGKAKIGDVPYWNRFED